MSTRRARIKAVASLPVRRKNADSQVKDEKPIKSPKTPRPQVLQDESTKIKTPVNKIASPLQLSQEQSKTETPKPAEAILSPPPRSLPTPDVVKTPIRSEKVPVITSISRQSSNTFASPLRWNSPARKAVASPVRNSPQHRTPSVITEVICERLDSPNSVQSNPDAREKQKNVPNLVERVVQKNVIQKIETTEDYNPPSIPESITDETGMDGIIPLQPTRSAPKPLDLLKNEIISENAQVLFDPIVPLPSPSKVRPKLRPAPRLAPHRRNSIQGSASESEDESRRALLNSGAPTPVPTRQRHDSHTSHSTLHSLPNREVSRIRNDSVCSGVSQLTAPPPASPLKERHVTKCRRQEMSRRIAAMRRRRDPVKRDALTMYDLIFYNPTTNPIVPDQDELKAKEANQKDEEERKKVPVEEEADDPDDPPADAAPVPQIKLGPNGEIMLDEQSLVIKQTDSNRKLSSSIVREGAWGGGGGRYSRTARTADWSEAETVRFYRALAAVGTDFTLMAPLFPDRNRRDLKIKFKKEERLNGAQVDKALRSQIAWDAVGLEDVFSREREDAARRAEAEREQLQAAKKAYKERAKALQQLRVRNSRGAKALETAPEPAPRELITANDFIQHALANKPRRKRRTPDPIATPNQDSPQKNTPKMPPLTNMARIDPPTQVPPNIEAGSLVVLTVNDPKSPTKKMLQTYISRGAGQLTPVALPPNLLTSVMGYVKKGTPRSNVSSPLLSPASVASADSRTSASNMTSVIQVNPSPNKRQRHSSYTITQL
ncbi:transcription factor TFIIIB component B'' [Leguminivora glycinivorella]|uniref:transcription factor TFIIIB component B'' n=1 Tax=Leguminivora glycinivorella TaxID=1035111 RepID=UPI00200DEE92|nr:transcription factor TFIIIB component B'' [Leguminivora glycinivorella]